MTITPEELAQGQLDAYNAHDLESFCCFFAEDIRVYDGHSHELLFEGMKAFRERYSDTLSNPDLHCNLVCRMVQDNIVIDQESVIVDPNKEPVKAIAVYTVQNQIIQEVRFY